LGGAKATKQSNFSAWRVGFRRFARNDDPPLISILVRRVVGERAATDGDTSCRTTFSFEFAAPGRIVDDQGIGPRGNGSRPAPAPGAVKSPPAFHRCETAERPLAAVFRSEDVGGELDKSARRIDALFPSVGPALVSLPDTVTQRMLPRRSSRGGATRLTTASHFN